MSENEDKQIIDAVLEDLGVGKFLIVNYLFVCLAIVFSNAGGTTFVFIARDTGYRCLIPECESGSSTYDQPWLFQAIPFQDGVPDNCHRFDVRNVKPETYSDNELCETSYFDISSIVPCDEWVYEDGASIVKEFKIPCEKLKVSLVGTVNNAGQMISLLITGFLSDNYGRKNVLIGLTAIMSLVGLAQSFVTTYTYFLIFECINLSASAGAFSTAYVLGIELLPPTRRIYGCCVMNTFYALSYVLLGIISWAIPNWKMLLRTVNVPSVCMLIAFFVMPESLRWLYAKGQKEECRKVIFKAAKMDCVTLSHKTLEKLNHLFDESEPDEAKVLIRGLIMSDTDNKPFLSIFNNRRLSLRLVLCSLCWLTNAFAYYGLSLNSVNISHGKDDPYINFVLVSLIELPGYIFYLILLRYTGRKYALFLTQVGSGIACIIYALTADTSGTLGLVLYLTGKLCMSASFALIYIFTVELFPTCSRSTCINFCSLFGKFGGALAPLVPLLNVIYSTLPMLTFGVVPIISTLTLLILPETKDKNLPDTYEEASDLR